jgi:hypothetical protein
MLKPRDEAYKYYFYFLQERMNIFWKRYNGESFPYINDNILSYNKFTNVYRACDRVSQYLIKKVIYCNNQNITSEDVLLRILVFKIFNKIETWEYIEQNIGFLNHNNFDVDFISKLLAERIKLKPIFNSAYMMTGTHSKYNQYTSKHEKWLRMVDKELIIEGGFKKIICAKSLQDIYKILNNCSFLGEFLSYQYAIDFNYSEVINFDENSYVKAGIGAIRGIKKCFLSLGNYKFEDAIKYTQDNLHKYQEKYGFTNFKSLFGREPTLIDLQNCFCETDKYLRVKLPELQVDNKRIKQKFTKPGIKIDYFFPPKWNINSQIEKLCLQQNSTVLTLF